jgi:hypothetical protein
MGSLTEMTGRDAEVLVSYLLSHALSMNGLPRAIRLARQDFAGFEQGGPSPEGCYLALYSSDRHGNRDEALQVTFETDGETVTFQLSAKRV